VESLSGHDAVLLALSPTAPREWRLRRGRREVVVPLVPRLVGNDLRPLLAAVEAGAGVLATPRTVVEGRVAAGRLVPVLSDWSPPPLELRVVFPSRSELPSRARLFINLLVERGAALLAAVTPTP
jgi:DNA-binding transcriptional LysR family regulator